MDWTSFIPGFCAGMGVAFTVCAMWERGVRREIKQLQEDIAAREEVIGSGLAAGLQRSACRLSAGLGDGRARDKQSAQAVQAGVEAYRRGYRPF